jgi:signal transduction histidine kinase
VGTLESAEDYFADLRQIALQSLKEMRLLIYELRPPVLEEEGLVGALQQRLDAVEGRTGMETRLLVDGEGQLAAPVEEALYRIASEALNNTLKHAAATSVTVRIRINDQRAELEIVDDGRGFDPGAITDQGGMGLVTMRERTERLGGTLTILSAPGEGTRVKVILTEQARP